MTVRIATIEDLDLITSMAMKFALSSPYKSYIKEDKIRSLAETMLKTSDDVMIVLVSGEDGMLAALAQPFAYGDIKVATEFAWWVKPNKRGQKAGGELLAAFEFWANKIGCKIVTVSCLDDKVAKHYENLGYVLQERAYLKEI